MKISKAIKQLQDLQKKHGDLELFSSNDYLLDGFSYEECDPSDYPADWNMPTELIRVNTFE